MSLSNGDRIGNYEVTAPIEKGGIEEPDVFDELSLPVYSTYYLLNSRDSQAFAKSQSRRTVRSEVPMASTVCSTLRPPK